jgi:hypothetical protein
METFRPSFKAIWSLIIKNMAQEFELYLAIGQQLELSHESQLFGKPCFKINGKPYISFFHNEMVFKLSGEIHKEALSLDGASLFDPSQKKKTHERMGAATI